ncbi:MAG TPA: tripartite tricarboxylate transporter substrate binding protein [Casimicrobiaceae bacterium]|nr:tripartite tricarboxylate transporter substrate binding protein [Casimicrobiaceae bacterium]
MKRMLRHTLPIMAAMFAMLASGLVQGQSYPNRPVRIIVAYPAGQGTDVATRYVAERMSRAMGQNFFVENRPGAGGNIGTEAAARAPADGYTLTMGTNATHGVNQFLYDTMTFDAERDFEPIMLIGSFPMVIAANPGYGGNALADVVALAKSTPKAGDIALPSTTARIVFELLKSRTQAPLLGVPYKGSAAATTEVMGGQLPLLIDTVIAARPHIASGKLKALAVTSAKPTALLSGARPVADQGYPGFEVIAWNALYAPKGTPREIIAQLNAELARILAQPETQQRLNELGFDVGGGSPADLADFGRSERNKWGPLIKSAGIRAE